MSYSEIQSYVKRRYGISVKTCWIAEVKESYGLTRGPAHNRKGPKRGNPCPQQHWDKIENALRHYNLL